MQIKIQLRRLVLQLPSRNPISTTPRLHGHFPAPKNTQNLSITTWKCGRTATVSETPLRFKVTSNLVHAARLRRWRSCKLSILLHFPANPNKTRSCGLSRSPKLSATRAQPVPLPRTRAKRGRLTLILCICLRVLRISLQF